ncbi:NACHT domain-containing protein [Xanthobacter sp. 91]|uniref:NACHT domain-containing protein n=1 Tax=Xanthobacter sp. 91 TaxID=1117244 RepID=UPI0012DBF09A|nr:NACHT domain-containing protein [Xanthobacter sp. 91]
MTEAGGPTTQAGLFYQNSVAAVALADLLDLGPQSPRERVIEVRVEAPESVDDIVIRYADDHRLFQNVKLKVDPGSDAWQRMWKSLESQLGADEFRSGDRLAIVLGEANRTSDDLIELSERGRSSLDDTEWRSRLSQSQRRLLTSVEGCLSSTTPLELLRLTDVTVMSLRQIESAFDRRRLGSDFTLPTNLLGGLRDIAASGSGTRAMFLATPLRRRLLEEAGIDLREPAEWGLPAYRAAISRLARIEIPGTGISGSTGDLFVWPRARSYDRSRVADFEDEQPGWHEPGDEAIVDLRAFPSETLHHCVVVAGPGHGKSALMWAIADRLAETPQVPVVIPLASLAASDLVILEFLAAHTNRELSVRPDWSRLAEEGLLTLLLDGLDEIPAAARPTLLARLATFSARYPRVPWLLSVRDPSVLTGAIQAELIELSPLDDGDILRFAATLKARLTKFDDHQFLERVSAYPELAKLARIPLFLTMLIAMADRLVSVPTTRADLIEAYLKTLFAPHEHKPSGLAAQSDSTLRTIAEQLAFERLEKQEVGASEREILDVIHRAASDRDADQILDRLRSNGVLRPQSSIRFQFPFPIVQEYLAACYLVRERRDTLASRIDDAVQRPWAQVIQFAIELHPEPTSIIRTMLERPADAFATGLRLVGRCIANGVVVEDDLRRDIERKLVAFWTSASTDARTKVGRLLTDSLITPPTAELSAALHHVWLLNDGAGDILAALGDRSLTLSVMQHLLDRGPKEHSFYFDLKPAISAAGDQAFRMILAHVRKPGLSDENIKGCAQLLWHFNTGSVTRELAQATALDDALSVEFRIVAAQIAGAPLDARLLPLVEAVIFDTDASGLYHAECALALSPDREEVMLRALRDDKLQDKRRQDLAGSVITIFPRPDDRSAFTAKCRADSNLPDEIRLILQIYAARHGDRAAFTDLIERFDEMPEKFVHQVIALFGHYPGRELAIRAVEKLRARSWKAADLVGLLHGATTGMLYIYEMDSLFGGTLKTAPPHAGMSEFLHFAEEVADRNDLTEMQRLSVLANASRLGSDRSAGRLQVLVTALDPDSALYDDDQDGHTITAAIREVRRRKILLPLAVGERFTRSKRMNVPMNGVAAIEAHANREALDLLLKLHAEISEWFERDRIANAVERLAARLSIVIVKRGRSLVIASEER